MKHTVGWRLHPSFGHRWPSFAESVIRLSARSHTACSFLSFFLVVIFVRDYANTNSVEAGPLTSLVASHQNGLSLRFCRTLSFTGFYGAILGFELDLNGLNWAFSRLYLFFGGVTWFFRILLAFTGFYGLIFVFFTGFKWVLLGGGFLGFCFFTYFLVVLPGFTGFRWVLLGFPRFYLDTLGFTGFYGEFLVSNWICYWVLLDFDGFFWILLDFI